MGGKDRDEDGGVVRIIIACRLTDGVCDGPHLGKNKWTKLA